MKFIDESILFKVNENYSENLLQFGDIKVVVVDDFYENPDLIRDLILSIPATTYTPQRRRGLYIEPTATDRLSCVE